MTATTLHKVLGPSRESINGGTGRWTPGRWRSVRGTLIPCKRGIHLCRPEHLLTWLGPQIWVAEYDGELVEDDDKVVVRRARIIMQTAWDDTNARLFAADCAEHILPMFETRYPSDDGPRSAIEVARAYARGTIGHAALAVARAAAVNATQTTLAAAWTTVNRASWLTSRAAALAADPPADFTAGFTAATAQAAMSAEAWALAPHTGDAASAAARAVERTWQVARLGEYLESRA